MAKYFTREEILEVQDLPFEDVVVPEWGEDMVRVAGMNALEATRYSLRMEKLNENEQTETIMPELLSRTLVNDQFERIFSEKDIEALGKKSAVVVKRLFEIALRLSGISEAAIEEQAKNSGGTPADDLLSG
jgi:hypothetical protein